MTNVAIVYYSATGNIHKLAVAAAEAAEKAGAEVRLRRVAEITGEPLAPNYKEWSQANTEHVAASRDVAVAEIDDLDWADAVVWGTRAATACSPARSSTSSTRPSNCTPGAG